MNISEFKSRFNLLDFVAQSNSRAVRKSGMLVSCPFHDDKTPSLIVHRDRWVCFGCGKYGDSIDFLIGCGYAGSVGEVISKYGSGLPPSYTSPASSSQKREYRAPDERPIERMHRTLLKTPWAMKKLENRGVLIPSMIRFKLGYGPVPKSSRPENRFSIPFYDLDGNLVTAKFRSDGDSEDKYLSYYGTRSYLYNVQARRRSSSLVYCGGQFDAIVLEQLGIPSIGPASETMFDEAWSSVFSERSVYVLLDNDKAGREWTGKVCEIVPWATPLSWPSCVPDGYDVTDVAVKMRGGKDLLRDVVFSAVRNENVE